MGELDARWVIGLVPWPHAFWAGGFLSEGAVSTVVTQGGGVNGVNGVNGEGSEEA